MSLIADILDRLTGIAVVQSKLDATLERVEKLSERFWDHELRLRMIEQKKLPGKPKSR